MQPSIEQALINLWAFETSVGEAIASMFERAFDFARPRIEAKAAEMGQAVVHAATHPFAAIGDIVSAALGNILPRLQAIIDKANQTLAAISRIPGVDLPQIPEVVTPPTPGAVPWDQIYPGFEPGAPGFAPPGSLIPGPNAQSFTPPPGFIGGGTAGFVPTQRAATNMQQALRETQARLALEDAETRRQQNAARAAAAAPVSPVAARAPVAAGGAGGSIAKGTAAAAGNAIVDAIIAEASRLGLPPALLLAVSAQETGGTFSGTAAGDFQGGVPTSFGAFQVHTPAHGGPAERWQGVGGVSEAARTMGPRWLQAFQSLGGAAAFQANPAEFYRQFQPLGQGSVGIDIGTAQTRIQQAYGALQGERGAAGGAGGGELGKMIKDAEKEAEQAAEDLEKMLERQRQNVIKAGEALFKDFGELIQQAQDEGVQNAQMYSDGFFNALQDAMNTGSAEVLSTAQQILLDLADAIAEASKLTGEKFGTSLEQALSEGASAEKIGAAGTKVMESLKVALEKGGKETREVLAGNVAGIIEDLRDLPAEFGGPLEADFRTALQQAIDNPSQETRDNLTNVLQHINTAFQIIPDGLSEMAPAAQQAFSNLFALVDSGAITVEQGAERWKAASKIMGEGFEDLPEVLQNMGARISDAMISGEVSLTEGAERWKAVTTIIGDGFDELPQRLQDSGIQLAEAVTTGAVEGEEAVKRWGVIADMLGDQFEVLPPRIQEIVSQMAQEVATGALDAEDAAKQWAVLEDIFTETFSELPKIVQDAAFQIAENLRVTGDAKAAAEELERPECHHHRGL